MYRSLGAVLVLAGVGILYLAASGDRSTQDEPLAVRSEIATRPVAPDAIQAAAQGAWRTILHSAPPADPAPTTVIVVQRVVRTAVPLATDRASSAGDRTFLIRDIQRELKRAGCYEGETHGVWTKSTRDAMERLTELVNAKLPTQEPDIVLLSLARGYGQDKSCDRSVMTTALPNAAAPPRALPLEGYMALSGPMVEAAPLAPAPGAAPHPDKTRASGPPRQRGNRDWIAELWKRQAN